MMGFIERLANLSVMPSARVWLITALGVLLTLSLLMVVSSSVPVLAEGDRPVLTYFWLHLFYITIAACAGAVFYFLPPKHFYNMWSLLPAGLFISTLLIITLLFGETRNGATRWLNLGPVNLQVAELVKVLLVLVVAEFMVRRSGEVRVALVSLWRLAIWYGPAGILLILQPDFGSLIVIFATVLVMFFVGGAPLIQYVIFTAISLILLTVTAFSASYRQSRIMSFIDPFDDTANTDYQLSRSLVAFGRGEFSGVGYGNSLLKLQHLPEAHNDFLLAVTGEELGFAGVILILMLELIIIASVMRISYKALLRHQLRLSYTCFGFAVVIFGQVLINAGMTLGLLPTKGLTMPFFSYGGSAMLTSLIMIGIILNIDKSSTQIYAQGNNRDY